MWIKWKYNDHGWPDFKELEVPDDLGGQETVEDYLCSLEELSIPTWSERFLPCRIKWEKIELAPEELKKRTLNKLRMGLEYHQSQVDRIKTKLKEYEVS